ncbi:prolactin-like isoform X1 [Mesocricetus auratus]|uniref:Prolactin-like isoform X1 n=1 Tax=Mesocricetus auratus TaxID=10036 RepID=A0A1U7Q8Q9_MESAU|nr:prolactin-like isoform X1 [Mesocricetus auratus]
MTEALLLPLLSSMLLRQNAASETQCVYSPERCEVELELRFLMITLLSLLTNRFTSRLLNEFEKEYASASPIRDKIPQLCYNYSLPVPDNTTEGQDIQGLLNMTIGMLVGWSNTLRHVATDTADLESTIKVSDFIYKIRIIVSRFTTLSELLYDVGSLLKNVHLEFEEDETYPASSALPSLHLLENPSRLAFYHVLLGCLSYNAENIVNQIKVLKCQLTKC